MGTPAVAGTPEVSECSRKSLRIRPGPTNHKPQTTNQSPPINPIFLLFSSGASPVSPSDTHSCVKPSQAKWSGGGGGGTQR